MTGTYCGVQICGTFLHFFNWIIRINGILSNRYLLIQNQQGCRFGAYIFIAYLLFIFNKYSSIANRMVWIGSELSIFPQRLWTSDFPYQ